MTTQIARWGNGLGVRLPKAVAQEARLGEGDQVEVLVENGSIVIRPIRRTYALAGLVSRITSKNRHVAPDWGAPAGLETWSRLKSHRDPIARRLQGDRDRE